MALTAGTRLGAYEIAAQIGEGGMGQVYRATDIRLKRQVAIKILPASLAADRERLARFQREAEVLASLNHPHIAAIYGLEESEGVSALVMELVEGEDLSQRIARGAIPPEEALTIAKQIAEALEAAHEQGIIHRDLKPANIKVRPDGTVKVLDFGLAKALDSPASSSNVSRSPTITTPAMTHAGMILGTAAYMSPEQARGRTVDKRADIWGFGCVLFEMLTGTRAFPGEDITDTLAAVVRAEPEWTLVPNEISPTLLVFLRRSLQKDPKRRVGDIRDMRLALEGAFDVAAPPSTVATTSAPATERRPLWRRAVPVAAAVVASAMVGAAAWTLKPMPPVPVTRFAFALGDGQQFAVANNLMLAVSPDGTELAYIANNQLYLRSMSDLEARPIAGTQQTLPPSSPVFSPNGESIAFVSIADRAIKKVSVRGGAAVTVYPLATPAGRMNWDTSGIVFTQVGKGIMRVSENGSPPDVLVSAKEGELMYAPQLLPGGEWLLFTLATTATADGWDKAEIVVQSLKSSERRTLLSGGTDARYLPTGHLVYALGGIVFAVPFDLRHRAITGGPVPMIEGVRRLGTPSTFVGGQFSVSGTGSLVYVPGPISASNTQRVLSLFDRNGTLQAVKLPSALYEAPRLSPDGHEIAVGSDDGKDANVWIADTSGATAMRRLTFGGRNRYPVWSPDGQRIAFQSNREGDAGIFWQRADGNGTAERLTKADAGVEQWPESFSPDGSHLSFAAVKGSVAAVWVLAVKELTPTLFAQAAGKFVGRSTFSPDGRWVAYSSNETGRFEIFVQAYPTGNRFQLGSPSPEPRFTSFWSENGKELIFNEGTTRWFAVSVSTQPSLTFGSPRELPRPAGILTLGTFGPRPYDMAADGQRVLAVLPASVIARTNERPEIRVVLNWTEELKRAVPAK